MHEPFLLLFSHKEEPNVNQNLLSSCLFNNSFFDVYVLKQGDRSDQLIAPLDVINKKKLKLTEIFDRAVLDGMALPLYEEKTKVIRLMLDTNILINIVKSDEVAKKVHERSK